MFFAPHQHDNVGQPRIQDETAPYSVVVNGVTAASAGSADAGATTAADLISLWQGFAPNYDGTPSAYTRHISFYDPDRARSETWSVAWEGQLPNTQRAQGIVSNGLLVDLGAQYCTHDVLPGDKVYFDGCTNDNQCDYTQSCYHDPASPSDVTSGMCLPKNLPSAAQSMLYTQVRLPCARSVVTAWSTPSRAGRFRAVARCPTIYSWPSSSSPSIRRSPRAARRTPIAPACWSTG